MTTKVAIIGAGSVGAQIAYCLLLTNVCAEILLVDTKSDFRDAQARDLIEAAACVDSNTRIRSASHAEAGQCNVIIVTIGSKHRIGEPRLESMYRNAANFRSAVEHARPYQHEAVIIVVSNPVEALTALAQNISGLPRSQVIGTGTTLAGVMLRGLIANNAEISRRSISAHVLGQSGGAEVVAWSSATVAGLNIDDAMPPDVADRGFLVDTIRAESHRIITAKRVPAFGISAIVRELVVAILWDKHSVESVAHFHQDLNSCLSFPAVICRSGVKETVPVHLDPSETALISRAAEALNAEAMQIMGRSEPSEGHGRL